MCCVARPPLALSLGARDMCLDADDHTNEKAKQAVILMPLVGGGRMRRCTARLLGENGDTLKIDVTLPDGLRLTLRATCTPP